MTDDQDVTSVFIRGESGTTKKHDLPLPWPIEDKLAKGQVHEVSDPDDEASVVAPEDSPVVAEREQRERDQVLSSEPKPESPTEVPGLRDEEPGTDEHTPAVEDVSPRERGQMIEDRAEDREIFSVERPATNAPKADWVKYARAADKDLSQEDAEAMTKAELQKR